MTVVFDLDNTLTDEMGSAVRPGMRELLERLRREGHTLVLWTNSRRDRARAILRDHDLARYFARCVFRENYDPRDEGVRKDIRKIGGDVLVDDSPEEIAFAKSVGVRAFRIGSFRKGTRPPPGEMQELARFLSRPVGFLGRLLGR
jgi:phosphoglycolate phosphatase-like HAD superfamily hydrolase